MKQENQFQFVKSQCLEQVTVLQAQMDDFSYAKHAHEEYSFGVTLAGRQDFFSRGAFHRSEPGHTIVFNPGDVHDGHSGVDDTLQYRMLYLHPEQLEPMLYSAGVKSSRHFRIDDTLLNDKKLNDKKIRQSVINLVQLIEGGQQNKLQQEAELYQLAVNVAQRYGEYQPNEVVGKADYLLRQAKDFIHDHLLDDISLDDISQCAHLSKYHFLRMFRQQFGITPHQYILNCRINLARKSLERGDRLDDIVFDCGFTDLSHFNRRFKPVFGMTPRQYQRSFLASI